MTADSAPPKPDAASRYVNLVLPLPVAGEKSTSATAINVAGTSDRAPWAARSTRTVSDGPPESRPESGMRVTLTASANADEDIHGGRVVDQRFHPDAHKRGGVAGGREQADLRDVQPATGSHAHDAVEEERGGQQTRGQLVLCTRPPRSKPSR